MKHTIAISFLCDENEELDPLDVLGALCGMFEKTCVAAGLDTAHMFDLAAEQARSNVAIREAQEEKSVTFSSPGGDA